MIPLTRAPRRFRCVDSLIAARARALSPSELEVVRLATEYEPRDRTTALHLATNRPDPTSGTRSASGGTLVEGRARRRGGEARRPNCAETVTRCRREVPGRWGGEETRRHGSGTVSAQACVTAKCRPGAFGLVKSLSKGSGDFTFPGGLRLRSRPTDLSVLAFWWRGDGGTVFFFFLLSCRERAPSRRLRSRPRRLAPDPRAGLPRTKGAPCFRPATLEPIPLERDACGIGFVATRPRGVAGSSTGCSRRCGAYGTAARSPPMRARATARACSAASAALAAEPKLGLAMVFGRDAATHGRGRVPARRDRRLEWREVPVEPERSARPRARRSR